MDIQDKTREQLIEDLQELREQNRRLKSQLDSNISFEKTTDKVENIDLIDFNYFELVFNTSPDVAIISRLSDSKVIKVNDGFTKITGYTREEALNGTRFNINLWQNPDDRELLLSEIQKHGAFENIETTMVRKNGTSFRSLVSARLFEFHGEQYVSSISRDITYVNNLEKELLESNLNARTVIEASNDVIILLDKNGLIVDTNEIHAKRFTLTRNDLIGKDIFKFLPKELAQNRYFYFKQVLETGKPAYYEDFRAGYWNEISCYPVFDESKKIDKVVIYSKDITERKKAETENQRIQKLLEESQRIGKIGGWELDIDSMELFWTSEMYAIHELDSTFNPMLDKRQNFFTPESLIAIDEAVKRTIKLGEPYDIEVEITTVKGNRKHIRTIGKLDVNKRRVFGYFQDITEKKLAEQEKKASDDLFKHVFENSNVGKSITSPDGQVNTNKAFRDLLGYGFDEFQHINWMEITHPDDVEASFKEINRIKKGEVNQVRFSKRFLHKNGSVIWGDLSSTALRNNEGELQYLITTIVDITEQKQTEEALRRSEINLKRQNELFDSLINNLSLGVFMVEAPSGNPLVANPRALDLLGRGILPDANKHNLAEVYKAYRNTTNQPYPVDEMPIIRGMMGEYSQIDDMVVERPDGTRTHLEIFGSPVKDDNGNIWASLVSFSDITERKLAEQALKESEERYHESQLIGNTAHWEYNFKTEKLYWSDQLYKMFEISNEDFEPDLKKTLDSSHVDDQDTIKKHYFSAIQNKKEYELESRIITSKGDIKYIITRARPKFDENDNPTTMIGTVVDITERKKIEEELKKSQEELRKFSTYLLKVRENERAEITLEIHDSVAQFLVALKVEMGLYLKKMSNGIDVVKAEEVKAKMEQLVSQVDITLKSARMIMNGLRPDQLDLLGLVEATEVYVHNFEEIHHIKCNFENTVSEPKIQKEQSIVLFRILQESLTNILKHAKANSVTVKLIQIENNLMLEIIDNGVGFDEKCTFRPDSYGVISMREQVKGLDGIFTITGNPGQGTSVRVEIPYKE